MTGRAKNGQVGSRVVGAIPIAMMDEKSILSSTTRTDRTSFQDDLAIVSSQPNLAIDPIAVGFPGDMDCLKDVPTLDRTGSAGSYEYIATNRTILRDPYSFPIGIVRSISMDSITALVETNLHCTRTRTRTIQRSPILDSRRKRLELLSAFAADHTDRSSPVDVCHGQIVSQALRHPVRLQAPARQSPDPECRWLRPFLRSRGPSPRLPRELSR